MRNKISKKIALILVFVLLILVIPSGCVTGSKTPGNDAGKEDTLQGGNTDRDNGGEEGHDSGPAPESPDPAPEEVQPSPEPSEEPVNTPGPEKKKVKAKALYLTGWTAGNPEKVDHFINLANTTEINAYVIDIKDDDGLVGYETSVPAVLEAGAWYRKYNVDEVLKKMHDNGIYVIGRLVCFKDPVLSSKHPELAIKKKNGELWTEKNSDGRQVTWLNPYKKENWSYIIEIAKEAVQKGFDEIQFDYVRFPGHREEIDYGEQTQEKYEVINEFLAYARKELPDVVLSADVFGIICESPGDTEKIGQYLEMIGKDIDYICPMVYPSHYALGQRVNGVQFAKPDLDPYGVVYNSLVKAKNRISQVEGYKASIRPYLQDFTASWLGKGYYQVYGEEQARQQIQAVYDAGLEEWIFWDPKNTYSESAFQKE